VGRVQDSIMVIHCFLVASSVSSSLTPVIKTRMTHNYLTLALILFVIGIIGIVVNRKNLILMLMSIELMLLSLNFSFITATAILDDIIGQIFALYVLVVAAAESAIGLSILVAYYRVRGTISVEYLNLLRG
jgi:NADH-quinone oxidoreductase subunit K